MNKITVVLCILQLLEFVQYLLICNLSVILNSAWSMTYLEEHLPYVLACSRGVAGPMGSKYKFTSFSSIFLSPLFFASSADV